MIARIAGRFPLNETVAALNRLFLDNPAAFDTLLEWVAETKFGTVTLTFHAGKFTAVEQTRQVR